MLLDVNPQVYVASIYANMFIRAKAALRCMLFITSFNLMWLLHSPDARMNHTIQISGRAKRLPMTNAYEKVNDGGSAYQGSYILQVNEVVITYNLGIPKNLSSPGAI